MKNFKVSGLQEKLARFEDVEDIFLIENEQHLVEEVLCAKLSEQIGSPVHCYELGGKTVVFVKQDFADVAIRRGKDILFKEFNSMSHKYYSGNMFFPIYDDHSIIATFESQDIDGLKNWCSEISADLLVKPNSDGHLHVLTHDPLEHICMVKAMQERIPFEKLLNYNYTKI